MDIKLIYFLAMPILASAQFRYIIKVFPSKKDASVEVRGEAVTVVSDSDRKVFNIEDRVLKKAAKKVMGKEPNDVFVKGPTPYGDFDKYKFKEVSKCTYSTIASVVGVVTKPVVVTQQRLRNKTSRKGTYTATISIGVESQSSSTWSKGGQVTAGVTIEYNLQFVSAGFSMEFSANWGQETTKTENNIITSTSTVSTELGPGETALARLTATKGTMKVRVEYESYLTGQVWCNYYPTYKGRHFKGVDISDLMYAANIPNEIQSQEVIEIGFYSDADIDLEDLKD